MSKLLLLFGVLVAGLLILSCEPLVGARNLDEGICWYADSQLGWVAKVSAQGDRIILRYMDVDTPVAVTVVPLDGSVWICDSGAHELVHVDLEGNTLKRVTGFVTPTAVAVDPLEETVWVIDSATKRLTKISPRGSIWDYYDGLTNPQAIAMDNLTSEVWVADGNNGLYKFDLDANPVIHVTGLGFAADVSTDVDDGRVYVADPPGNRVFCLTPSGDLLWVYTGAGETYPLQRPSKVQAAPSDTVWILETNARRIRRISANGQVNLATRTLKDAGMPVCLAMYWKRDEVWLGDVERHRIVRNNKGGEAVMWMGGLGSPVSLSIYDPDLDRKE
jgi:DNA-binding beta-propeller fold protein YncE